MKRLTKRRADILARLIEKVNEAAVEFNAAVTDLESFRDDVHTEAQEYFENRSERWQESEAGDEYQEFVSAWETDTPGEAEEIADEAYPVEVGT